MKKGKNKKIYRTNSTPVKYKRVLIKLGGESLAGEGLNINPKLVDEIASYIIEISKEGVEVAITVGGGNIFRGESASKKGMERVTADNIGMLATVMNGLALQDSLERLGSETRVLSAIEMKEIAEPYIRRRAIRHLEKGRVVIFCAGTGSPYFTTDTSAVIKAKEIDADIIMKATKVDGVYDKDPMTYSDAKMFDKLNYLEAINRGIKVIDTTALSYCMEYDMPIAIFNLNPKENMLKVIKGNRIGTVIDKE
ncbi:MAG: UMP kinase [Actinomycetia bacterium]|nr:UMP kinase [Actinomycetes bacterium]